MTTIEFAAMLNGREYGEEMNEDECELAKDNDLIVVFGYSDDRVEFCGVIGDEFGAYCGSKFAILPTQTEFKVIDPEIVEEQIRNNQSLIRDGWTPPTIGENAVIVTAEWAPKDT